MEWRMKVFDTELLHDFAKQHADVRTHLVAWLRETEKATWQNPNDIKARHVTASLLSENRVIFNIKGNSYRLLVKINYQRGIVVVLQIGTHAEYDKWKL
jgi:mRNA interferase HigB